MYYIAVDITSNITRPPPLYVEQPGELVLGQPEGELITYDTSYYVGGRASTDYVELTNTIKDHILTAFPAEDPLRRGYIDLMTSYFYPRPDWELLRDLNMLYEELLEKDISNRQLENPQ